MLPSDMKVEYEVDKLTYSTTHTYNPDFTVSYVKADNTRCFIEYKGNGRAFDLGVRQKMIAVKQQYPQHKFYIVFHTDGKIGFKRKNGTFTKQSDWANKYGFDFCIGKENIKQEWFE